MGSGRAIYKMRLVPDCDMVNGLGPCRRRQSRSPPGARSNGGVPNNRIGNRPPWAYTPAMTTVEHHRESAPAPMSWAAHARATLALGIPLVGSQLGLILMNTTDTIMLGWYGVDTLAAAVLATKYYFVVMIFGAGFSHAVVPMAAQAASVGDRRGVRRSVRMGLWMVTAYAIIALPAFFHAEEVLVFLGQDPAISALAGDYMFVAAFALLPTLWSHTLRAFLSAIERTRIILATTLGAVLLNVAINWMLIFGNWGAPEMGIEGAAIATLAVNVFMFGLMALYSTRHRDAAPYGLFVRLWRPDWPGFFELFRVGLPISIMILAEVGMFIFTSIFMGWVSVVALAAHGIVLQLASIAFMVPMGMAQAATVRAGRAFGRRDRIGLDRAAKTVIALCIGFACASAIAFLAAPETLIGLFLDRSMGEAEAVIAYAVPLIFIAACFQLADSAQAVAAGLLRGLKDTRVPMVMAVFSYWGVGLPLAWLLGFPLGLEGVGVWIGLAAGLVVATILLNGRFFALKSVA